MAEEKTFKTIQVQPDRSFKVEEKEMPKAGDNDVLVKVQSAAVNLADVVFAKGKNPFSSPPPCSAGYEGAGIIAEVGKNHSSRLKVGDRVSFQGLFGSWGQYILVPGDGVFLMHPDNTFDEAAAHFTNPATVVLQLREVLREGHKTVIHSAGASHLGKMMIRLFKEHGIKIINLVRRDDVKDELYKLGADYVLNIKDSDFDEKLKEVIEKEKPTKAYDAICGDFTAKLVKAMPPKSIISVYGLLSGKVEMTVTIWDLFGGKTLNTFAVTTPYAEMSFEEKVEFADYIQKRLKTSLKSDIVKILPLEKTGEAVEHSEEFASKGKVVIHPWE